MWRSMLHAPHQQKLLESQATAYHHYVAVADAHKEAVAARERNELAKKQEKEAAAAAERVVKEAEAAREREQQQQKEHSSSGRRRRGAAGDKKSAAMAAAKSGSAVVSVSAAAAAAAAAAELPMPGSSPTLRQATASLPVNMGLGGSHADFHGLPSPVLESAQITVTGPDGLPMPALAARW